MAPVSDELEQQVAHINHMTYARYFIPDFVEEEKVLYLDSDLVVTADLTSLFEMDLGENYLAAAPSCFGAGIGFNAGVLLINNKKWRAEAVRQQLVELTEREHQHVGEGDQSILNMLFHDSYASLDQTIISRLVLTVGLPHMDMNLSSRFLWSLCQPSCISSLRTNLGILIRLGVCVRFGGTII